jgi:hypothetical protein
VGTPNLPICSQQKVSNIQFNRESGRIGYLRIVISEHTNLSLFAPLLPGYVPSGA